MRFTQWANDHILLLNILLGLTIFVGLVLGYRRGGWKTNSIYLWSLFLFLQYYMFSPIYFYVTGRKSIIGTDISEYYGLGFWYSFIGILFFSLGYWMARTSTRRKHRPAKKEMKNPGKAITILFYGTFVIVLGNMALGGISLQNAILGNETIMGTGGASYFLQNFADSLIAILVMAFLFKIPQRKFILWIFLSFFLFSLLGFRYRMMLTLFGLGFVYLGRNKVTPKQIVFTTVLGLVVLYIIIFSTINRTQLILKQYSQIEYNPAKFDAEGFFNQTRGDLADMAVYKLYDNPNKFVDYDYGLTMFGYVFIRMIPRSIYADKDRFYPPPQIKITFQAYDAWWGSKSGEAILSNAAIYIAWGWLGIVLGYFAWGFFLQRFNMSVDLNNNLSFATSIVIALVSFQWITRSYFPQTIDHFVYMMAPVWILRFYRNKYGIAHN